MSESALSTRRFGPYPAADFRVADGTSRDGETIRQALWYFERETIALPLPGRPVAKFTPGVEVFEDVRAWAQARAPDAPIDFPPLIWIAAPEIVRGARFSADEGTLADDASTVAAMLVPKIPLNRSWFDPSSARYFGQRMVRARGTTAHEKFVIRTLWPEDFRLTGAPPVRALPGGESPQMALRTLMREEKDGGASSPYAALTLWQRAGTAPDWRGRPVLAFMVNGAQGDDDEAHGGHFAIVTGRVENDGAIGDWLVNNFYTLDAESEKGILAAPTPLDNYLGDLNSGQAYYRPSCMIVAVLSDERAAALVQSALGRVYNQFYRHQLVYYHPNQNCASISVDTLRALGWSVPARGATSPLLAWAGFPLIAAKDRSIAKAKLAFDYLCADLTRLMPAAALEEIFASLLALAHAERADHPDRGALERMLVSDVDALAFVRFPQFPSSRAVGGAPAVTTSEYNALVPSDPAQAKIIPVPPRPFPADLRDPDLLPLQARASDIAAMVWGVLLVVGIPLALARLWRWLRMPVGASGRWS